MPSSCTITGQISDIFADALGELKIEFRSTKSNAYRSGNDVISIKRKRAETNSDGILEVDLVPGEYVMKLLTNSRIYDEVTVVVPDTATATLAQLLVLPPPEDLDAAEQAVVDAEAARDAAIAAAGTVKSYYHASVYVRSATEPTAADGGSYNFTTGVLIPPTGYVIDVPAADGNPCWVVSNTFSAVGDDGTDSSPIWTAPIILVQDGEKGDTGAGFTGGSYDSETGVITFTSDDDLEFSTDDIRGDKGDGYTGGAYDTETGIVTFTSDDGLGFATDDLRGEDGADSTVPGPKGDGWTGGSYNVSTGIVTFSSDNGLGFSTDDLRGATGKGFTGGSYSAVTGIVTFTSGDGLGFSTDDLRGEDGADSIVPGPKGDGFTGGSYNAATGVVTFTSDDGLGFTTDDLRGEDGAGAGTVTNITTGTGLSGGPITETGTISLDAASIASLAKADSALQSVAIGSTIQGYSAVLDATTASFTTTLKTKLDGIEASATADQTGAEIKAAYEGEADTNAFTDAEKTKVGHITVTQAVDLDAIETRVNELDAAIVLQGTWDASSGSFPGTGSAQAGHSWIVSTGGTVDGTAFNINDRLLAIVDDASTSSFAANWHKLDYTDQVLSVAGRTGAVTLTKSDITDFDDADYASDEQGTKADNAMPKAGGTFTDPIEVDGVKEPVTVKSGTTPALDASICGAQTTTSIGNITATVVNAPAGKAWVLTWVITGGGDHSIAITGADWGDVGAPEPVASGDKVKIQLDGRGSTFEATEIFRSTA